jgi:ferrous iron transport protein A
MEMGLVPGVEVSLIGVAPLGDPIEISLRGYRLSLRRSEAARVHVAIDA